MNRGNRRIFKKMPIGAPPIAGSALPYAPPSLGIRGAKHHRAQDSVLVGLRLGRTADLRIADRQRLRRREAATVVSRPPPEPWGMRARSDVPARRADAIACIVRQALDSERQSR